MALKNKTLERSFYCAIFSLPPVNEVWGKVIFSEASVILYIWGCLCMMSFPVWLPGHTFLLGGEGSLSLGVHRNQNSGRYASYLNAFLLSCYFFITHTQITLPNTQKVVVDKWFSFQSYFAQLTHDINIVLWILIAVHTDRQQQVLGWPCKLWRDQSK